jgi:serine/threonine-protein kinase
MTTLYPRLSTERLPTLPAGAASDEETQLQGVTLLGRYRLERPIGKGGMSVIYAARHVMLGGPVAVKVLRSCFAADEDATARFLREAKASARVRHEHVIEILDFGIAEDGVVFMVMELLEGEDLAATVHREGALPWSRVRGIALQICSALQAAHEHGVVHRDVTLGNCLRMTRDGNADYIKLLDFGIAKLSTTQDRQRKFRITTELQVFGTPAFMAPEQARRTSDADPRTDVYSTGCVLYALLTGHLPFEGKSRQDVLSRQLYGHAPSPRSHEPTIAPAVSALLGRALEKDPRRRFQSMAELAAAIRAIPPSARSPEGAGSGAWEALRRWWSGG